MMTHDMVWYGMVWYDTLQCRVGYALCSCVYYAHVYTMLTEGTAEAPALGQCGGAEWHIGAEEHLQAAPRPAHMHTHTHTHTSHITHQNCNH
jgi:hypothetical protein